MFSAFSTIEPCRIVETQNNFNITEYLNGKWYVQMQQVTNYLPIESNFCVSAEYNLSTKKVPFYNGLVIDVHNYANENFVNGYNVNKNNSTLCARIPNDNFKSKLLVAPCFSPNFFAGDYWVVAAGPNSFKYEWAIVSAGQPNTKHDDGCTTDDGFWFFTRKQVASKKLIDELKSISIKKGFSLEKLNYVNQKGCLYT
jgi:lipocalin